MSYRAELDVNRSTCLTRGWNFRKRARNSNSWRRQPRLRKQSPARRESLHAYAKWRDYGVNYPSPKFESFCHKRDPIDYFSEQKNENTHSKKRLREQRMRVMQLHSRAPRKQPRSLHLLVTAWSKMKFEKDAFREENNDSANMSRIEYFVLIFH